MVVGIVLLSLATIGCSSTQAPSTQSDQASPVRPAATSTVDSNNWVATEKTDPMDSTKEIALMTDATNKPKSTLIVRFKDKKLDVYVNTDQIVNDESASVRIKFDDGVPIRQTWTRSTDYRAISSPESYGLIAKLQTSAKFYIEYQPYQRVPDTIIFNVEGLAAVLPQEELGIEKKKYEQTNAANAALRAKILLHVHECRETDYTGGLMFPGKWCWSDPDDPIFGGKYERGHSATKEGALEDGMSMARYNLAFKK
jgi:hypothetical protein